MARSYAPLLGFVLLGVSVAACHTPRASGVIQHNRPFDIQEDGRVAMGQVVSVGEVPQHIDISGRDESQPVLLYMHGGPGHSALPAAHSYTESLERHYIVVHWDQRGTQRSFSDALEDFPLTHERLVADTLELSRLLADWFKQERIVLVAEGSAALPALAAARHTPEAFYALVLLSPMVDAPASIAHAYRWALDTAHQGAHREALLALQPLGEPPWSDAAWPSSYRILNRWLDRLGGTVPGQDAEALRGGIEVRAPAGQRSRPRLASRGEAYTLERLSGVLATQDLAAQMPVVDVPLFFIVGEADQRAPFAEVEAYYRALEARGGKTLVKLEGVGHWPLIEAPDRVLEVLAGRVWPMAR